MLLLADRNFPGWELWGLAAGTGADLAWRIKKNLVFTPLTVLPDGSFLSVMPTPAENLRLGQARAAAGSGPAGPGHTVRIIEYTVTVRAADGTTRIEPFRLATTLLDHQRAPAAALAALYHQRWESECPAVRDRAAAWSIWPKSGSPGPSRSSRSRAWRGRAARSEA